MDGLIRRLHEGPVTKSCSAEFVPAVPEGDAGCTLDGSLIKLNSKDKVKDGWEECMGSRKKKKEKLKGTPAINTKK